VHQRKINYQNPDTEYVTIRVFPAIGNVWYWYVSSTMQECHEV